MFQYRYTGVGSAGSPMFSGFIFGLFDLISAPPLSLSQIGYAIVLLPLVCFAGS